MGVGECAPLWGLSPESKPELERTISHWQNILSTPDLLVSTLSRMSSLRFGLESAMRDLATGGRMMPFEVDLSNKIPINGLIWMSDAPTMLEECRTKVEAGYTTIKFKVGALDFDDEVRLIRKVRQEFSHLDLDIRLDANGAFSPSQAMEKLDALSAFRIHSIEQPLKAGNQEEMARLVEKTPIAIALDEELIGVHSIEKKTLLLDAIQPHYLVLKPTLHGSFSGCDEWIDLAEKRNIGWWATSALESNIGLNAIAQWVLTKKITLPQGLGTGGLFTNNIDSPWVAEAGMLRYDASLSWNLKPLLK
jgi:o-succinylbenzoate synthase